jgi:uncharacterized protein YbbC (DUF1343 family)
MSIFGTENKKHFVLAIILLAAAANARPSVELGIDVLEQNSYVLLHGKRVGLITNQTGVDSHRNKNRILLN